MATNIVPELFPVKDINWANPTIYRTGVTPIYDDGTHKWLGFGVSNYATNIVTIGGSWEPTDHDLLTTAVREYNEEVGSNMNHITEDAVYECYAVQEGFAVQILLPVRSKIIFLTKTTELRDVLWLTTKQCVDILTHKDYHLNPRTKAFAISAAIINIMPILVKAVDTGIPFKKVAGSFLRPQRIVPKIIPELKTEFSAFEKDIENSTYFKGHINLIVTSHNIGILRDDGVSYVLPLTHLPQVMELFNKKLIRIYIALNSDRDKIAKYRTRSLNVIEADFKRTKGAETLGKEFLTGITSIRAETETQARLVKELYFIEEYETKLYEVIKNTDAFVSEQRACFLKGLNIINVMLERTGITFLRMESIILPCKDMSMASIIIELIRTGLIVQNRFSTELSLK